MFTGHYESRLAAALDEHRRAIDQFLASAGAIAEADWKRPVAQGKWSPGQIAEHLSLSLEAVLRELSGGPPMRIVLPWWKRWLARRRYLRRMLREGSFPSGVKAPREIRPAASPAPRGEALERLRLAAAGIESFYAAHEKAVSRRLCHPYFGAIPARDLFGVLTLHAVHHRRQLVG